MLKMYFCTMSTFEQVQQGNIPIRSIHIIIFLFKNKIKIVSGLHQAVAPCGCRVFCTQTEGNWAWWLIAVAPSHPNSAHDFPQDQRGSFILHSALHQPTGSLNYTKSRNEVQRKKQVPWYGLRFWPFAQSTLHFAFWYQYLATSKVWQVFGKPMQQCASQHFV